MCPSTVGSTNVSTATQWMPQRKTFYANSLFWDFYSDGTNLVYCTSVDGVTWSAPTTVRTTVPDGYEFSVRHKNIGGTDYVYHAWGGRGVDGQWYLRFRRGVISGAFITWGTDYNCVSPSVVLRWWYPDLCIDSNDVVYVAVTRGTVSVQNVAVYRNPNNDGSGSWTEYINLLTTTSATYRCGIVALTSGRVYVAGGNTLTGFLGNLWNGSAWVGVETIDSSLVVSGDQVFGLVAYGDDLGFAFRNSSGVFPYIHFRYRTYGVGWGAQEEVSDTSYIARPHLTIDLDTGDFYCFFIRGATIGSPIHYRRRVSGVWQGLQTLVASERYPSVSSLNCFWEVTNQTIGVTWTRENSPYEVRYEVLTIVVPPTVVVGLHPSKVLPLILDE